VRAREFARYSVFIANPHSFKCLSPWHIICLGHSIIHLYSRYTDALMSANSDFTAPPATLIRDWGLRSEACVRTRNHRMPVRAAKLCKQFFYKQVIKQHIQFKCRQGLLFRNSCDQPTHFKSVLASPLRSILLTHFLLAASCESNAFCCSTSFRSNSYICVNVCVYVDVGAYFEMRICVCKCVGVLACGSTHAT
jgi:hypothetical protein